MANGRPPPCPARSTANSSDETKVIRLENVRGTLVVIGEDRSDVAAEVKAMVSGASADDAKRLGEQFTIEWASAGEALVLQSHLPESRRRVVQDITLRIPSRLGLDIEAAAARIDVKNVASVHLDTRAGTVELAGVSGAVSGEHRSGRLQVSEAGEVDLAFGQGDIEIVRVTGAVTLDTRDGRATVRDIGGTVTLETRRTDVETEAIRGALTVAATDGRATLRNVTSTVTFKGERCSLDASLSQPAALTADVTDAGVDVQLSGGATLDLEAVDATIRTPAGAPAIVREEERQRVTGPLANGGPTIKVRTRRGDIELRLAASPPGT